MQNRKTNGQYSSNKSGKAVIWLVGLFIIIGVVLYNLGDKNPSEAPVETATFVQPINQEDARVEEYLKSEQAKLQAKLAIYEQDKVNLDKENAETMKKLEADYQESIKLQRIKYSEESANINANLDSARKAVLQSGSTTVKGN